MNSTLRQRVDHATTIVLNQRIREVSLPNLTLEELEEAENYIKRDYLDRNVGSQRGRAHIPKDAKLGTDKKTVTTNYELVIIPTGRPPKSETLM